MDSDKNTHQELAEISKVNGPNEEAVLIVEYDNKEANDKEKEETLNDRKPNQKLEAPLVEDNLEQQTSDVVNKEVQEKKVEETEEAIEKQSTDEESPEAKPQKVDEEKVLSFENIDLKKNQPQNPEEGENNEVTGMINEEELIKNNCEEIIWNREMDENKEEYENKIEVELEGETPKRRKLIEDKGKASNENTEVENVFADQDEEVIKVVHESHGEQRHKTQEEEDDDPLDNFIKNDDGNDQEDELDHEIEFIDGSEEAEKSPVSIRSRQMRFYKTQRNAVERSELACIPELTQESAMRNSTNFSYDERQDILHSVAMSRSQVSEFKTVSGMKSLKEFEIAAAERLRTQESPCYTEMEDLDRQPKALTESKSSNIETMNAQNKKDLLPGVNNILRARSQEGTIRTPLSEGTQYEEELDEVVNSNEEVMHHIIEETSQESKSSFEIESELPPKNNYLAFTFGHGNKLAVAEPSPKGSKSSGENILIIDGDGGVQDNIVIEKPLQDEKSNKTLRSQQGSSEAMKEESVQEIRSAAEQSGSELKGKSNSSSAVDIKKASYSHPQKFVKKVEQPDQQEDDKNVNRSKGARSGEDEYANEEFDSLVDSQTNQQYKLSAFQSHQTLLHEQNSQNSQNQYILPDPESIDDGCDEEEDGVKTQNNDEKNIEEVQNKDEKIFEGESNLSVIKKEESSNFALLENHQEGLKKPQFTTENITLFQQTVSVAEGEDRIKPSVTEEEAVVGDSSAIRSTITPEIKGVKSVPSVTLSKKDLGSVSGRINLTKQSASPESEPRVSQQSSRSISRAEELIQRVILQEDSADFSEDIPIEIQKGAVPKVQLQTQSQDETLPSVIQRGVVPDIVDKKEEEIRVSENKNERQDLMYGMEELSANRVEDVRPRTILPHQEVDHYNKLALSEEQMIKMTRRVPAPVMKRKSSSKIRARNKSISIHDEQQRQQTLLPEVQLRILSSTSNKKSYEQEPRSRPSESRSPQTYHQGQRKYSPIQKKKNGHFIIQNIDVVVPEIERDDPQKYRIDVSPTRLQPLSNRRGSVRHSAPWNNSVIIDERRHIPVVAIGKQNHQKTLLVEKNSSDSSADFPLESDEIVTGFEREQRKRSKEHNKELPNQVYYLKRNSQEHSTRTNRNQVLEPLNHSRVEYQSRISAEREIEEISPVHTNRGYNPYRERQTRHSSVSHQSRDELEETSASQIQRKTTGKGYKRGGVPEDVAHHIRKAMAKQKDILKKVDALNPYNPYWTKKVLNDHFGVDIEPINNDSELQSNNRWKLKRIKQHRHDTNPRDSQQDVPVSTSQQEDDKVIYSQDISAWDSSRNHEIPHRRPTPNGHKKRAGSNPHRRLSPMPIDTNRREQIQININNYLIHSTDLYGLYSTPKHHQEAAVGEVSMVSPIGRPKYEYQPGAKRSSMRRHNRIPVVENSYELSSLHVRGTLDY